MGLGRTVCVCVVEAGFGRLQSCCFYRIRLITNIVTSHQRKTNQEQLVYQQQATRSGSIFFVFLTETSTQAVFLFYAAILSPSIHAPPVSHSPPFRRDLFPTTPTSPPAPRTPINPYTHSRWLLQEYPPTGQVHYSSAPHAARFQICPRMIKMRLPVASAEGWNLLLVSKESLQFLVFLLIAG